MSKYSNGIGRYSKYNELMWINDPAERRPKGSNVGEADMRGVAHTRARVGVESTANESLMPARVRAGATLTHFNVLPPRHPFSPFSSLPRP